MSVIFRKLEDDGNTSEMAVNGSVSSKLFRYTVPTGKTLALSTLTGRVQTKKLSGLPRPAPGCGFGHSNDVLTNGVQVYIRDASLATVLDFTVDGAIKRNCDWGILAGGNVAQIGDDCFSFTIDFAQLVGIGIDVPAGYQIVVKVRDDLTAITESFEMSVGGVLSDE